MFSVKHLQIIVGIFVLMLTCMLIPILIDHVIVVFTCIKEYLTGLIMITVYLTS